MSELKDQPLHASSSEAVTNNVRVEVESRYAPEHSQPFQNEWFFYYTIRITNEGDESSLGCAGRVVRRRQERRCSHQRAGTRRNGACNFSA